MIQKYFRLLALLAAAPLAAQAQTTPAGGVGIGTPGAPHPSAALEVQSTSKGLLPPRLTTAQRDAIAAPAAGLTIYNTTTGALNTWDGTRWTAALADTTPAVVPATITLGYSGGAQTYTVPAGVTSLQVDLAGAAGGPMYSNGSGQGLGGRTQALLAVTPGQVLTIYVGEAGWRNVGGDNGGGGATNGDGGGGGASDVRTGAGGLADRVLEAGGGGGGGDSGAGGAGGGLVGGAGGGTGGGGGTQVAGGAGSQAGTSGQGGAGNLYNGGGGGGYYGGGSGNGTGGGGGGSSYAGPGTSAVLFTQGYRSGNGYVTIVPGGPANQPAPYLDGSNISGVIRNQTTPQVGASFNITGSGAVGGPLGIGTSTPATTLDVRSTDGSARLTVGTTANKGGGIAFGNPGHGIQRGYPDLSADNNVGFYTTSGNLYLSANGTRTDQFVLRNDGTLGIGTGSPDRPLTVQGAAGSNNELLSLKNNGGTTKWHWNLAGGGLNLAETGVADGRLYLNVGGNVGIGTTTPTATLDVNGATRLRGLSTAGVVTTDASGNLGSSSATAAFGTSFIQNTTSQQASSNFNVSGNGTVGGTLTAANAVVSTALTGNGGNIGTVVGLGVRADGGLNIGQNTSGSNIALGYAAGSVSTGVKNQFIGYAAGSGSTTGNNNVFSGYGSGNANLTGGYNTFEGAFSGNYNTGGNYNTFFGATSGVYNTTGSNNTALGYNSGPASGSGPLDNATAVGANVTLTTSNTVVLGNGANVGIGTSAPAAGLHVLTGNSGVASGTGAFLSGPPTGNPNLELRGGTTAVTPYVDLSETSGVDYSSRLISSGGTLNVYSASATALKVNGNALVTGTLTVNSTVYNSDARFKQYVRPLAGALAAVLALRGVRYEWNALGVQHGGKAGAPQVGLIAQELEAVYPELVSTDAQGYKAVNYAQLAPVLIEALKELKAENDALKQEAAAAKADAGAAKAQAAQATATLETFEARLRRLEAAIGGQAQR